MTEIFIRVSTGISARDTRLKKKGIKMPHGVGCRRLLSYMRWMTSFSGCQDVIEKSKREGLTEASHRLDGEMGFLDALLRCILRTMALGPKLLSEFLCSYVARAHSECVSFQ